MNDIGSGAARLLGRLAIDPSSRQADVAKELGITRSAVNQIWNKLVENHNLRIYGNLDYGFIGMQLVFGWVIDTSFSVSLPKFLRWISSNPFATKVFKSEITSLSDSRVFFEALLPTGSHGSEFIHRLNAFEKAPYNLKVHYSYTTEIGTYLNMGLLRDQEWQFDSGFKLEATIDGARPYADILPVSNAIYQTPPKSTSHETLAIISLLERDYFANWKDLARFYKKFNLEIPSERTLRRRIKNHRQNVLKPYINIENIGLTKTVIVSLSANATSEIYKLLRAQSILFPKVRAISGRNSIVLNLELPEVSDWLFISNTMSNIVGSPTQICTFIAEQIQPTNWLENIAQYVMEKSETKQDVVWQ